VLVAFAVSLINARVRQKQIALAPLDEQQQSPSAFAAARCGMASGAARLASCRSHWEAAGRRLKARCGVRRRRLGVEARVGRNGLSNDVQPVGGLPVIDVRGGAKKPSRPISRS